MMKKRLKIKLLILRINVTVSVESVYAINKTYGLCIKCKI